MATIYPSDLAGSFASLAHDLFGRPSLAETLDHIAQLAVSTIDGCDHAGIWVVNGQGITREIQSDPLVKQVDNLQLEDGEGPCLDALRGSEYVLAGDIAHDTRYPRFGAHAVESGVAGVLSERLVVGDDAFGSLNLYASKPNAYDEQSRQLALLFSAHAGIVLAAARACAEAAMEAEGLRTALSTRDVIGQAKGILMEREKVTPDEAFEILRQASQRLNVKLREVAERLAQTGELPGS
jgi:GAF domain-containing protein